MSNFPEDLRYTPDHEWARPGNGRLVRVGVTAYATEQLGDIVFISLPEVGEQYSAGDACGELESTKAVSELMCPVTGVVTSLNEAILDATETVNKDPYGDGWLFEVELDPDFDIDDMLDSDSYAQHVDE